MANYIQGLFHGIRTLLTGLKVTGKEFVTPKITEQYPENRATLKMNERFCGTLTMPHDAEGKNKCVACGLCQAACPNGTIKITTDNHQFRIKYINQSGNMPSQLHTNFFYQLNTKQIFFIHSSNNIIKRYFFNILPAI